MLVFINSLVMPILILVMARSGTANPTCTDDALMTCVAPSLTSFLQSPEFAQISSMMAGFATGNHTGFTVGHFTALCTLSTSVINCGAGHVSRCISADAQDAHDFVRGALSLIGFCGKADAYQKLAALFACGDSIESNNAYTTCRDAGRRRMKHLGEIRTIAAGLDYLRSGRVVKELCCNLTDSKKCADTHIVTCPAEAVTLHQQVFAAIFAAYDCPPKMADGCPVAA